MLSSFKLFQNVSRFSHDPMFGFHARNHSILNLLRLLTTARHFWRNYYSFTIFKQAFIRTDSKSLSPLLFLDETLFSVSINLLATISSTTARIVRSCHRIWCWFTLGDSIERTRLQYTMVFTFKRLVCHNWTHFYWFRTIEVFGVFETQDVADHLLSSLSCSAPILSFVLNTLIWGGVIKIALWCRTLSQSLSHNYSILIWFNILLICSRDYQILHSHR